MPPTKRDANDATGGFLRVVMMGGRGCCSCCCVQGVEVRLSTMQEGGSLADLIPECDIVIVVVVVVGGRDSWWAFRFELCMRIILHN